MRVEHPYVKRQERRRRRRDRTWWTRVYFYYRREGAPDNGKRLPDDPAGADFAATLRLYNERAEARPAKAAPSSFAGLADAYQASPDFTDLAKKTRKDYGRILAGLVKSYGELPFASIDREVVYAIRDSLKSTPHMANYTVRVLRLLLGWAVERKMLDANPAARPRQLRTRPRHQVWSPEAEVAFLEHADAPMRLAYLIGVYTAQRQADVLKITWRQYDGKRLELRQEKTGALIAVPVHSALKAVLDATQRRAVVILTTDAGRAFKADHFRHEWRKVTLAAGLDGLQWRDLRRTGMVRLAEAGATVIEVSAVSGHDIETTQRILETYIPRNAAMASAAITKLEAKGAKGTE